MFTRPSLLSAGLVCAISGLLAVTGLSASSAAPVVTVAAPPTHDSVVRSPGDLHLVGDARLIQGGRLRLVRHLSSVVGGAWTVEPVQVAAMKVHIAFQVRGLCADGMAIVIQNDGPDAIGADGGDLGYSRVRPHGPTPGITHSLAIELDTYQNEWDPPAPHLSLQTRGTAQNDSNGTYSITSKSIPTVADGNRHSATVSYHDGLLNVWFDGHIYVSRHLDLANRLGLTNRTAYVGLTAANGACRAGVTIDRFDLHLQ